MRGITKLTQFNLKLTAVWLRLIDILLSSWCTKVSLKTATVSEWSQPWSLASKQPFKMQQDHKLFALSHSNSVCATVYNNRFPQCDCSFGKSSPRTQFPLDDLTKWRLNDNNTNNSNKWRQRNVGMKIGNRIIRCGNDLDSLLFLDKDWGDLKKNKQKTSDPAGMKKTRRKPKFFFTCAERGWNTLCIM